MTNARTRLSSTATASLLMSVTLFTGGEATAQAARTELTGAVRSSVGAAAPTATRALAAASADDPVNQVLAISVDGLNPRAITRLGRSGAPSFHRLMREGAFTLNARTVRGQTRTLPNHTTMLTSRRIDRGTGGHGVTFNHDNGRGVHAAAGRYVPSVFDVVHDHGGSTALYTAKDKFRFFSRSWNSNGRADRVGRNHGRAKIDKVRIDNDNARLVRAVNADLRNGAKTFTFLHISLPDAAGHRHGFMGSSYLRAVRETDRLLGTVLDTVRSRSALRNHLLVVLTADHGGSGRGHNNPTRLANYRVPFMAWGPGVRRGRNLYDINPTFRYPGTSRPGYEGKQPVRNGDLANLATDVLDLPELPGSEFNRPRTLNLF